ncbi:MAG: caspase family protein, partial [Candidatus Electrothrix sp. MAN1_4]|nr:caspase family protein [Candidatus Electrothrix sp. MAN1_4]
YDDPEINFAVDAKGKRTDRKYLNYAGADAREFVQEMRKQAGPGRLYRKLELKVLINEQADRGAVLDGLDWIERETKNNDVAMVFFAGHGKLDRRGDYFFLPKDFEPGRFMSSGVSYDAINSTVSRIQGKALFFVDTCYSGKAAGLRGNDTVDITKIINDLSATENGVIVLSATTGQQTALELHKWKHGAFTQALLEALSGDANYIQDKVIQVSEIRTYIAGRVKTLTNGHQTPAVVIPRNVPDFPVVFLP